MHLSYVYRTLESSELIVARDEWTLRSLFDSHPPGATIWGPCSSFVGKRVHELERNRLVFRRLEFAEARAESASTAVSPQG